MMSSYGLIKSKSMFKFKSTSEIKLQRSANWIVPRSRNTSSSRVIQRIWGPCYPETLHNFSYSEGNLKLRFRAKVKGHQLVMGNLSVQRISLETFKLYQEFSSSPRCRSLLSKFEELSGQLEIYNPT